MMVDVTWDKIKETVGASRLVELLNEADLLALVNWTMVSRMSDVWDSLMKEVCPKLDADKHRYLFVDLADPKKRSQTDLKNALETLKNLNKTIPVTLGLNESETDQIARQSRWRQAAGQ